MPAVFPRRAFLPESFPQVVRFPPTPPFATIVISAIAGCALGGEQSTSGKPENRKRGTKVRGIKSGAKTVPTDT